MAVDGSSLYGSGNEIVLDKSRQDLWLDIHQKAGQYLRRVGAVDLIPVLGIDVVLAEEGGA